jgi:hypothetical protein
MISFTIALLLSFAINFVAMLILRKLSIGPKTFENKSALPDRLVVISYVVLFFVLVYSAFTMNRLFFWTYIYAAFVGSATFSILFFADSSKTLRFCVLSLPVLMMATSLAISGPAPLTSDEGRFTGFAFRIVKDGKWIPFQYTENSYYQSFPIIPFLKASLSMIMGADMINIVHPLLVLILTVLTTLAIYTLARRILSMMSEDPRFLSLATLAPLFFLSTPTLSTIGFIPEWVAVSLYLMAFMIILSRPYSKANLILVLLISLTGVLIHAVYPVLMLASLGVLILTRVLRSIKISGLFEYVLVVTLAYWTSTIIMNDILSTGIGSLNRYLGLLGGGLTQTLSVQAEYSAAPSWMAYPWALAPSLSFSMIFIILGMRILKNRKMSASERSVIGLATFGLFFLVLGFVSRTFSASHVALVRYSYVAYYLLLPASIYSIREVLCKGRILTVLLITLIITSSAFFAIQDPMFSPDVYRITTDADKRSWTTAETLAPLLSPNVGYLYDSRVNIGITALILRDRPELYREVSNAEVVIVNLDSIGEANLGFWFGPEWVQIIESGNYSIIFSDGCYKAYMKIEALG